MEYYNGLQYMTRHCGAHIYTLTHLHTTYIQVLINWLTEKQTVLQHIGTLPLSTALWPLDAVVSGGSEKKKRVLFEIKAVIAGHVGLGSE